MELTGKIIQVFDEIGGTSSAGRAWRKREYLLETQEQFPKKIIFDFFGDRIDQYPLQVGQVIKLSFDINCREYNGRWFTNISGWHVEHVEPGTPQQSNSGSFANNAIGQNSGQTQATKAYDTPVIPEDGPKDDLPF